MPKKKSEKTMPKVLEFEQKVRSAMKSDIEDLYQQFIKGTITYDHFVQCFKENDFWMICFGRLSIPDEYEFTEDFLHYSMSLVFPVEMRGRKEKPRRLIMNEDVEYDHEKAEQLFGIYLTYTAFFTQPQSEVKLVRLRVDLAEYLVTIMQQLVFENQYHALYCLQRLVSSKAFMIVPFDEDHNPLLQRRFNTTQEKPDLDEIVDFGRLENVTKCQDVTILSELHTKYEELKKKCGVPKEFAQRGQNVCQAFEEITAEALEKYNASIAPPPTSKPLEESIIERVSSIKKKAMERDIIIPRHRRHKFGFGIDDEGSEFEQRDDENEDEEESSKKKQQKKKPDPVQTSAKARVARAQNKTERIRRETEGTVIAPDELIRMEVESDMAHALEKQTRRSPRKKRDSTTASNVAAVTSSTSVETSDTGGSPVRRRSARLTRKSTDDVHLPPLEMAKTPITKAALQVLEQSHDADFQLKKLRSMKK